MFTLPTRHTNGFTATALRACGSVWELCASWHRRRRNRLAVKQLMGWNDHMLRDIGLTRADIRCALREHRKVEASGRLRILAVERRANARAQTRGSLTIVATDDHPTDHIEAPRITCGA